MSLSAWLALVGLLASGPQESAGPRAQDDATAVLETPEGESVSIPLSELDPEAIAVRRASFVRIEGAAFEGLILPHERAQLRLAFGELAVGRIAAGSGDRFELQLSSGSRLEVRIEELASVVFPARADLAGAVVEGAASGDRLWRVREGELDRIDGTIEGFSAEGVAFESVLGRRTFAWKEVAALFVDPGEVLATEAKGRATGQDRVVVDLVDGSRLQGRLARLADRTLVLARPAGELSLTLASLRELSIDDGRALHLTMLPIVKCEERSPFGDELGLSWPHRIDRSVSGAPLRAGGREWSRGLGVHAPSRLTWKLDGTWKTLRGFVAVDDEVMRLPGKGSVRFRVHLDGKPVWESAILRGGDAPLAIEGVSLQGALELTLEVDPSTDLFVADRADWLRPILVRGS